MDNLWLCGIFKIWYQSQSGNEQIICQDFWEKSMILQTEFSGTMGKINDNVKSQAKKNFLTEGLHMTSQLLVAADLTPSYFLRYEHPTSNLHCLLYLFLLQVQAELSSSMCFTRAALPVSADRAGHSPQEHPEPEGAVAGPALRPDRSHSHAQVRAGSLSQPCLPHGEETPAEDAQQKQHQLTQRKAGSLSHIEPRDILKGISDRSETERSWAQLHWT